MTIFPIILLIWIVVDWTIQASRIGKEVKPTFEASLLKSIMFCGLLYLCGFFNVFNWPQITYVCMLTMGLVIMGLDREKSFKYGFWTYIFTLSLVIFIYVKGGAFQYFNK